MLFGRTQKNPIKIADKGVVEWKYATCGYCSTGCAIEVGLNESGKPVSSRGVADADVNRGKLCLKGIYEHELFDSAGRGTVPRKRDHWHEDWQDTDWDTAMDTTHDEIRRIQEKYGRDSFAVISTGQNNYDGNTTLCMASAVSGYKRSFGSDGPPGSYEDFEHTDCLIAWGSNLPEQHPIIYWRMKEAQEKKKFPLIVVDPRVTMLAQTAYIEANTNDVEALREEVAKYDPTTAAKICGIDEDTIRSVARLYANAGAAMSIWTMGINQSTHGSDGVVGINNPRMVIMFGPAELSHAGKCARPKRYCRVLEHRRRIFAEKTRHVSNRYLSCYGGRRDQRHLVNRNQSTQLIT